MIDWASGSPFRCVESAGPASRTVFERSGLASQRSIFRRSTGCRRPRRRPCTRAGFPGALGVGAAAAPTVEQAWRKALAEAFAVRSAGAKLSLLDPAGISGLAVSGSHRSTTTSSSTRITIDADARGIPRRERRSNAGRRGPAARGWRTRPTGSQHSATGSSTAGSSAYAVDVTSPDVAGLGLEVTRAVAPELARSTSRMPPAFSAVAVSTKPRREGRTQAQADERGRAQPRPAPVPVTSVLPTSQFASLVHGSKGVVARRSRRGASRGDRGSTRASRPSGSMSSSSSRRARSSVKPWRARAGRTTTGRRSRFPLRGPPGGTLGDALARRRSASAEALRPVGIGELSTRARRFVRAPELKAAARFPRRARSIRSSSTSSPSRSTGSRRGVYHFDPFRHRLARLGRAFVAGRSDGARRSGRRSITLPRCVVGDRCLRRSRFKYGLRGYRFALLEAGHVVQNAVLAAADLGSAGASARRLLRPAARPHRRSRRPRRGDRLRVRSWWRDLSAVAHAWARLAAGAVLAAVLFAHGEPRTAARASGGRARFALQGRSPVSRCTSSSRAAGLRRRPEPPCRSRSRLCVAGNRGGRARRWCGGGSCSASCFAPGPCSRWPAARSGSPSRTARGRGSTSEPARRSAASTSRPERSPRPSPRTGPTTSCFSGSRVVGPQGSEPRHERGRPEQMLAGRPSVRR